MDIIRVVYTADGQRVFDDLGAYCEDCGANLMADEECGC